jgi:ATP adenylyltransferase
VSNEQLWAPWRLQYILGDKDATQANKAENLLPEADPNCFVCQAVPERDNCPSFVIERGIHTITLLNRYPYNNGHLLVAPKRHLAALDQLGGEIELELSRTISRMVGLLERTLHPQGFNIGLNLGRAAGAGLPGHLHWHIVPRWVGDTNFMPVLAGVNTIPQALEALWELLTSELGKK